MSSNLIPTQPWAPTPTKTFAYAEVSTDVAAQLRAAATRVRERHRQQAAAIIASGHDLIAAKVALPHGSFGSWLAAEFGWDERTARNYMAVAAEFGGKSEIVSDLAPTSLYALASAPAAARETVLNRLQAGEIMAPVAVRNVIHETRDAESKAKQAAKLSPEERRKAAAAEKAQQTRRDREHERWRKEQDRRDRAEAQAADEAAHLIHDALGNNAAHLVELLTSHSFRISVLCEKLQAPINREAHR